MDNDFEEDLQTDVLESDVGQEVEDIPQSTPEGEAAFEADIQADLQEADTEQAFEEVIEPEVIPEEEGVIQAVPVEEEFNISGLELPETKIQPFGDMLKQVSLAEEFPQESEQLQRNNPEVTAQKIVEALPEIKEDESLTWSAVQGVGNALHGLNDGFNSGLVNTLTGVPDLALELGKFVNKGLGIGTDSLEEAQEKLQSFNEGAKEFFQTEDTEGAGEYTKPVGKFLAGLLGAKGATAAIKGFSKLPTTIRGMSKAGLADFFGFDGSEKRMSDMIQEVPALKNPVTEYLASDPEDSRAVGRFKNAVEGLGLVGATGAIFNGVRFLKNLAPNGWLKSGKSATIANTADDLAKTLPSDVTGKFSKKMEDIITKGGETRDTLLGTYQSFLLSSPSTHMKNIIGNTAVALNSIQEKAIARGISKISGSDAIAKGELASELNGMFAGIRQGIKDMSLAYKTGSSQYGRLSKLDIDPTRLAETTSKLSESTNPLSKGLSVIGRMTGSIGKALNAEDEFFKTVAYTQNTYARISRQIASEGLTNKKNIDRRFRQLLKEVPENIQTESLQVAHTRTFTQDLGKFAQSIENIRRDVPSTRFVIPFFRTISNLTKFGLERVPILNLGFKTMRDDIAAGGARRFEALAKTGAGLNYGLMASFLYSQGKMTGSGPSFKTAKGRGELGTLQAGGWQANSIKVGDKWINYADIEPIGSVMKLFADGAEIIDHLSEKDDIDVMQDVVLTSVMTMAQAITDNSWAVNANQLFDIMMDDNPKRMERYLANFASGFIPNILKRSTNFTDSNYRDAQGLMDKVRKSIPGLSDDLPARRDVFGRVSEKTLKGFTGVISPFRISKEKDSGFEQHFIEQGFRLPRPSYSQWFDGVQFNLREHPEKYSRMLELSGEIRLPNYGNRTMTEFLKEIVTGTSKVADLYNSLTDGPKGGKEKFVKKAMADYRRSARAQILVEDPIFKDLIFTKKQEKLNDLGNYKEKTKAFKKAQKELQ